LGEGRGKRGNAEGRKRWKTASICALSLSSSDVFIRREGKEREKVGKKKIKRNVVSLPAFRPTAERGMGGERGERKETVGSIFYQSVPNLVLNEGRRKGEKGGQKEKGKAPVPAVCFLGDERREKGGSGGRKKRKNDAIRVPFPPSPTRSSYSWPREGKEGKEKGRRRPRKKNSTL